MPKKEDQEAIMAEVTTELRYMNQSLQDLRDEVKDLSKIVTDTRIKVAGQASLFGILGGAITAGGHYVIQKLMSS